MSYTLNKSATGRIEPRQRTLRRADILPLHERLGRARVVVCGAFFSRHGKGRSFVIRRLNSVRGVAVVISCLSAFVVVFAASVAA